MEASRVTVTCDFLNNSHILFLIGHHRRWGCAQNVIKVIILSSTILLGLLPWGLLSIDYHELMMFLSNDCQKQTSNKINKLSCIL